MIYHRRSVRPRDLTHGAAQISTPWAVNPTVKESVMGKSQIKSQVQITNHWQK